MFPLTRFELTRQSGSLVDILFDWNPITGELQQVSDNKIMTAMRVGGFPGYATTVLSRDRIRHNIEDDITMLLSGTVTPGLDLNPTKTRTVLDVLLREPGGILNASSLGNHLAIDRRTVERYIDLFIRLFLLHWLPNLAIKPARQEFSRAKLYAFDTSFAVNALEKAGVSLPANREALGKLLESYVVGQLRAHAEWASSNVTMGFWRQAGSVPQEVDLVMIDESERLVAVEVKSSTTVTLSDFNGMRTLDRSRQLHRGFVFYRGASITQFGQNLWSLPMSVLDNASNFEPPAGLQAAVATRETMIIPEPSPGQASGEEARIFLSYVHDDDQREAGRIVKFTHDLVDAYSHLYGHDLRLFIDREGIPWGQQWEAWLTQEAGAATFLLVAVTPNYLRSDPCREELLNFAALAARNDQPTRLILPLLWVDVTHTDVVANNDPVLERIRASQWEDVTNIWQLTPNGPEYTAIVRHAAARLHETIASRDKAAPTEIEPEGADLIELTEQLTEAQEMLTQAMDRYSKAIDEVGELLNTQTSLDLSNPRAAESAFTRLAVVTNEPRHNLDLATNDVNQAWNHLASVIEAIAKMPLPDDLGDEVRRALELAEDALVVPDLEEAEQAVRMMSSLSRQLRPLAKTLSGALQVVRSVQASASAWSRSLAEQ